MSTLRQMIEREARLSAHCESYMPTCTHFAQLKLDMLVQRFGWEFDIVDHRQQLRRRLVCSICGARWPALIMSPSRVGGHYT